MWSVSGKWEMGREEERRPALEGYRETKSWREGGGDGHEDGRGRPRVGEGQD